MLTEAVNGCVAPSITEAAAGDTLTVTEGGGGGGGPGLSPPPPLHPQAITHAARMAQREIIRSLLGSVLGLQMSGRRDNRDRSLGQLSFGNVARGPDGFLHRDVARQLAPIGSDDCCSEPLRMSCGKAKAVPVRNTVSVERRSRRRKHAICKFLGNKTSFYRRLAGSPWLQSHGVTFAPRCRVAKQTSNLFRCGTAFRDSWFRLERSPCS